MIFSTWVFQKFRKELVGNYSFHNSHTLWPEGHLAFLIVPLILPPWLGLSNSSQDLFPFFVARVIGTSDTPIIIVGNKRDLQKGRVIPRWNVSNLVKKTWKCGYIECSAKYNWHILLLFSELLKSVGCARCKHVHTAIRFQGALRRNRCTIM